MWMKIALIEGGSVRDNSNGPAPGLSQMRHPAGALRRPQIGALIMRILSIILTTLICTIIVFGLTQYMDLGGRGPPGMDSPHFMLALLGGVFGFWLSYTGRLARMFRKV